jgi:hypothetical protein
VAADLAGIVFGHDTKYQEGKGRAIPLVPRAKVTSEVDPTKQKEAYRNKLKY